MASHTPIQPSSFTPVPVESIPDPPAAERTRRLSRKFVPLGIFGGVALVLLAYAFWPSMLKSSSSETPRSAKKNHIEIEVLNGTGAVRIAQRITDYLRSEGFDVVEVRNTDETARTVVMDRLGYRTSAEAVGKSLGLPPERVVTKINRTLYLDVSVVVGKDFSTLKPFH
jgi:hypothetical protein